MGVATWSHVMSWTSEIPLALMGLHVFVGAVGSAFCGSAPWSASVGVAIGLDAVFPQATRAPMAGAVAASVTAAGLMGPLWHLLGRCCPGCLSGSPLRVNQPRLLPVFGFGALGLTPVRVFRARLGVSDKLLLGALRGWFPAIKGGTSGPCRGGWDEYVRHRSRHKG